MKKFSKSEAVRFGWDSLKKHLGFFLGLSIFMLFALALVPEILGWILPVETTPGLNMAGSLIWQLICTLLSMGIIKITIDLTDNKKVRFVEIFSYFSQWRLFLKYIAGGILYGLMVTIGYLLLIIPGIILSIRFGFYFYYIIDENLGPIQALKKSWASTKGSTWNLFLFDIVVVGIAILGFLALGVGLIVAYPVSMIAYAYVYRRLQQQIE